LVWLGTDAGGKRCDASDCFAEKLLSKKVASPHHDERAPPSF
jgi:hypothetical protein